MLTIGFRMLWEDSAELCMAMRDYWDEQPSHIGLPPNSPSLSARHNPSMQVYFLLLDEMSALSCALAVRNTSCSARQLLRWRGWTWLARRSTLCCAPQLPRWRGSTWPFRLCVKRFGLLRWAVCIREWTCLCWARPDRAVTRYMKYRR